MRSVIPNFNVPGNSFAMVSSLDDIVSGNNYLVENRNVGFNTDYIARCIEKTDYVATFYILYYRTPISGEYNESNVWVKESTYRLIDYDPTTNDLIFFILPEYANMISETVPPNKVKQTVERNIKKDASFTIKNLSKNSDIPLDIANHITKFFGGKRKLKISRGVKGSRKRKRN